MSKTKADLHRKVEDLAEITRLPLVLNYTDGKPRVYNLAGGKKAEWKTLSPRLAEDRLFDWLTAWEAGYLQGYTQGVQDELGRNREEH